MEENLLIIHPRDADRVPTDIAALKGVLTEIGFIGDSFEFNGQSHYKPGNQFLQLITFLGCSPVVSLGEPGATGKEFCHIHIGETSEGPTAYYGSNTKPPRCPSCGYREKEWHTTLDAWNAAKSNYLWQCPKCDKRYPLPVLKWRQSAGFCRFTIMIWGIFEGEAVPTEQLLEQLENESGFTWNYFYLRTE